VKLVEPKLNEERLRAQALKKARKAAKRAARRSDRVQPKRMPERIWVTEKFEDHYERLESFYDREVKALEKELAVTRRKIQSEQTRLDDAVKVLNEERTRSQASDPNESPTAHQQSERRRARAEADKDSATGLIEDYREQETRFEQDIKARKEELENRNNEDTELCQTLLTEFDSEFEEALDAAREGSRPRLLQWLR
jgi:hypothetical protein